MDSGVQTLCTTLVCTRQWSLLWIVNKTELPKHPSGIIDAIRHTVVLLNHVPFLKLIKNLQSLYSAWNVKVGSTMSAFVLGINVLFVDGVKIQSMCFLPPIGQEALAVRLQRGGCR